MTPLKTLITALLILLAPAVFSQNKATFEDIREPSPLTMTNDGGTVFISRNVDRRSFNIHRLDQDLKPQFLYELPVDFRDDYLPIDIKAYKNNIYALFKSKYKSHVMLTRINAEGQAKDLIIEMVLLELKHSAQLWKSDSTEGIVLFHNLRQTQPTKKGYGLYKYNTELELVWEYEQMDRRQIYIRDYNVIDGKIYLTQHRSNEEHFLSFKCINSATAEMEFDINLYDEEFIYPPFGIVVKDDKVYISGLQMHYYSHSNTGNLNSKGLFFGTIENNKLKRLTATGIDDLKLESSMRGQFKRALSSEKIIFDDLIDLGNDQFLIRTKRIKKDNSGVVAAIALGALTYGAVGTSIGLGLASTRVLHNGFFLFHCNGSGSILKSQYIETNNVLIETRGVYSNRQNLYFQKAEDNTYNTDDSIAYRNLFSYNNTVSHDRALGYVSVGKDGYLVNNLKPLDEVLTEPKYISGSDDTGVYGVFNGDIYYYFYDYSGRQLQVLKVGL